MAGGARWHTAVLVPLVIAGCSKPADTGEAASGTAGSEPAAGRSAPAAKSVEPAPELPPPPPPPGAVSIGAALKAMDGPVPPLDPLPPAQEVQLGFKPIRLAFVGWTEDGRRFVLRATHRAAADTDDAYTITLRQVHDAVTGQMIDSYRVNLQEGVGALPTDPVARAWQQARPAGAWKAFAAGTPLVSARPFRVSPAGTAEFVAALDGEPPHGSTLTIEPRKDGFDTVWSGFSKPVTRGRSRLPVLDVTLVRGQERWDSIAYRSGTTYQHMVDVAEGNPKARVDTAMRAYWSPLGDRVVWVMTEHERDVRQDIGSGEIVRYYVRSAGPQIKVVDAGVGDEPARQVAAILDHNRLPVTVLERAETPSPVSKIYYRGGAAGEALARRISELLPGALGIEPLAQDGWVHAIVVLGN